MITQESRGASWAVAGMVATRRTMAKAIGDKPNNFTADVDRLSRMRRTLAVFALATAVASAQNMVPVFEPMQPELLGTGSTFTNAFADFDGDGDPDMFVGFDGKPNRLYRNDKGTFDDVA